MESVQTQGVFMVADGIATFTASGLGKNNEDGSASFRGHVYFATKAPSLLRLNSICGVHEWETDTQGNGEWTIWEWK